MIARSFDVALSVDACRGIGPLAGREFLALGESARDDE